MSWEDGFMSFDDFSEEAVEHKNTSHEANLPSIQPASLQNFPVQCLNIVPIEIVARRFPTSNLDQVNTNVNVRITISELHIFPESSQAQVIMDVKIEPSGDPVPYEMFFRVLGIFSYEAGYSREMVHQFLQQGCISVMLPFIRELVFSISSRLQIPPILLSLIQLTPPSTADSSVNDPLH
jgi:preprotein translocase subunit SecB